MMHLLILAVHLLATIAKLVRPGGVRAVVAESLLLKHQLVISWRIRKSSQNGSRCRKNGRLPNSGAFSPRVVRDVFEVHCYRERLCVVGRKPRTNILTIWADRRAARRAPDGREPQGKLLPVGPHFG
jgi:hypothetical protein